MCPHSQRGGSVSLYIPMNNHMAVLCIRVDYMSSPSELVRDLVKTSHANKFGVDKGLVKIHEWDENGYYKHDKYNDIDPNSTEPSHQHPYIFDVSHDNGNQHHAWVGGAETPPVYVPNGALY